MSGLNRRLPTNCPNCAAPLTDDGNCEYCGTKIRYANTLDLEILGDYCMTHIKSVELELRVKQGNDICIFPLVGEINQFSLRHYGTEEFTDSGVVFRPYPDRSTKVMFEFEGEEI